MTETNAQMSLPLDAIIQSADTADVKTESYNVSNNGRCGNRFMIKGGIVRGQGKARRLFVVGYIRMGGRFHRPDVPAHAVSSLVGTVPA